MSTNKEATTTNSNQQRIWQVVSQIPEGKVASYGQIAQLAEIPQAARLVGNVLRQLPKGSKLPWHRVVNSQGKISLPKDSPSHKKQKQRLIEEGIIFHNDKIIRSYFIDL